MPLPKLAIIIFILFLVFAIFFVALPAGLTAMGYGTPPEHIDFVCHPNVTVDVMHGVEMACHDEGICPAGVSIFYYYNCRWQDREYVCTPKDEWFPMITCIRDAECLLQCKVGEQG